MTRDLWGDAEVDRGLCYLHEGCARADAWQVSATGRKNYRTPDGVRVAPAGVLLRRLV